MTAAAADVMAGEVTRAVRDATTPVGPITEGDWLGIVSGAVEVIAADCADAAWQVLDRMVGGDSEVATIITGNDADETITDVITSRFSATHPEVAVEVVSGEQPLYPYLFGVE
jgi:dihydroxyacetone kinase-like predicted kinase